MAFEGGDRFKVLTMKLPLCMALILSMTLKYDDFSKQIRNELGDHVVNEQKTTLSLETSPSMHHRQNSFLHKTIRFLRRKIPTFNSKLISLVKNLLILNVSGYG